MIKEECLVTIYPKITKEAKLKIISYLKDGETLSSFVRVAIQERLKHLDRGNK